MTEAQRPFSRIALAGLVLAFIALALLALAGPSYRLGWNDIRGGFELMRWAAYCGALAAAVSLVGCVLTRAVSARRGLAIATLGLVLGLVALVMPPAMQKAARSVPPIHDITTDTDDPPVFVAIAPLRAGVPNGSGYAGAAVAEQQKRAYPHLRPLVIPHSPAQSFLYAEMAAASMGWTIVAADPATGRIEASATTFWFGFTDDVVVRIRPDPGGARIDMRSKSRIGRSDLGRNARRVQAFLDRLPTR